MVRRGEVPTRSRVRERRGRHFFIYISSSSSPLFFLFLVSLICNKSSKREAKVHPSQPKRHDDCVSHL